VASATVVADDASEAGSWATAAFLLGPEAGLAALEGARGIEGALLLEDGGIAVTSGMDRYSDLPGSLYALYPGV
jgi:thiamine biosynthesis lipoprotein ApbE